MISFATIFVLGVSLSAARAQDDVEIASPPAEVSPTLVVAASVTEPPAPTPTSARHTTSVAAVQRAAPSVVAIKTQGVVAFGRGPLARRLTVPTSGEGSGALIDPRGLVLTNAHVVAQAQNISVVLSDGRTVPAKLLGLDSDLDLAVLEVPEARGLPVIPIGSSADLMLGETVIAIGNPLGLGSSVSQGVVSQPLREVELKRGVAQDYIRIDASINPGNSGGALVNLDGELVGDEIVAVNGRLVADAATLEDALLQAKAGHRPAAAFTVVRGNARVTLSLAI